MKVLICFLAAFLVNFNVSAQDSLPWIQRPENVSFLAMVDSVFELRFKKPMDLFPVMDAGAFNFAQCETQIGACTEEYIYNEAYMHEMMTFSGPIEEYTVASVIKAIESAGDNPSIAHLMYLLDPDKYWIGYYPMGGKYLLVICLSVDREKVYSEMGLRYGK